MSDNKVITNSNRQEFPQQRPEMPPMPQPEPQTPHVVSNEPKPMKKKVRTSNQEHDTKTAFLTIVTFVFGFVSLLALVFVLKVKKEGNYTLIGTGHTNEPDAETSEIIESPSRENQKDSDLNLDTEIFEMDKINLDAVINNYTDDILEEGL